MCWSNLKLSSQIVTQATFIEKCFIFWVLSHLIRHSVLWSVWVRLRFAEFRQEKQKSEWRQRLRPACLHQSTPFSLKSYSLPQWEVFQDKSNRLHTEFLVVFCLFVCFCGGEHAGLPLLTLLLLPWQIKSFFTSSWY